jgi:hypothetical protein
MAYIFVTDTFPGSGQNTPENTAKANQRMKKRTSLPSKIIYLYTSIVFILVLILQNLNSVFFIRKRERQRRGESRSASPDEADIDLQNVSDPRLRRLLAARLREREEVKVLLDHIINFFLYRYHIKFNFFTEQYGFFFCGSLGKQSFFIALLFSSPFLMFRFRRKFKKPVRYCTVYTRYRYQIKKNFYRITNKIAYFALIITMFF